MDENQQPRPNFNMNMVFQNLENIKKWEKHIDIERKYLIPMHEELGELYGIPKCCVTQFCKEIILGIPAAQYRQLKHKKVVSPQLGYVPCDKCMKKI